MEVADAKENGLFLFTVVFLRESFLTILYKYYFCNSTAELREYFFPVMQFISMVFSTQICPEFNFSISLKHPYYCFRYWVC